jgi:hypothetical protein
MNFRHRQKPNPKGASLRAQPASRVTAQKIVKVGGFVRRPTTIGIAIVPARPKLQPSKNWVHASNAGNLAACTAFFMAALAQRPWGPLTMHSARQMYDARR